jgi:hypothetical protein
MVKVSKEIRSDRSVLSLLNVLRIELKLDSKPEGRYISTLDIPFVSLKYYLNLSIYLINRCIFAGYFVIE